MNERFSIPLRFHSHFTGTASRGEKTTSVTFSRKVYSAGVGTIGWGPDPVACTLWNCDTYTAGVGTIGWGPDPITCILWHCDTYTPCVGTVGWGHDSVACPLWHWDTYTAGVGSIGWKPDPVAFTLWHFDTETARVGTIGWGLILFHTLCGTVTLIRQVSAACVVTGSDPLALPITATRLWLRIDKWINKTISKRNTFQGSGPLCDFRCNLLLQLHFNSFPDAYLVPIELILCIMEKIVLSPIWCDFIRDKMSIKEGVERSYSNKVSLKTAYSYRA